MEAPSSHVYPVLPLRDIVVFPGMVVPLFVGRERSIRALESAVRGDKKIFLVAQKNATQDEPSHQDLYEIGTVATILQLLRLPDGTVKVLVEGFERGRIEQFVEIRDFFIANITRITETSGSEEDRKALVRSIMETFDEYVKLNKKIPPEIIATLNQISDHGKLADTVAAHIPLKIPEKQAILELTNILERLEKVFGIVDGEISVMNTEKKIRTRVKKQMEKSQRDYYLNEQLKAIQKELGENEEGKDELSEMEDKIKKLKLSKEAREKASSELKKLRTMNSMAAEATVLKNYLEWVLAIPWKRFTKVRNDIIHSEKVLNDDHFGLEKVKERILEYLAVQQRTKKLKGPILCLVGPPGVGKTSLARSIAKATGRNFVKMSLGGVRDEAEIRGHRRTYIGSMPGKIIQSMRKAKSSNPLFLLDEIDKMGADMRGDPSSALLEVLDPEQNHTFNDHYLEVDYDLSDVMFFATANSLQRIQRPLLDRMEVIHIPGYTEDEKLAIARKHLIPKTLEAHGVKTSEWSITDPALRDLIRYYTREAGVRNLERQIATIIRKGLKEILQKKKDSIKLTPKNLDKYAGVRRYSYGMAEKEDMVGITTGLAYTDVGGDLLLIESVVLPGKGKISYTGKLGEVMQESVQAAYSYVRSRSPIFGIRQEDMQNKDIHVHVPEGATPKDGPSAGIAMTTTIVSVLTGIPVRKDVAMTGEVTLRGRVLPIGGLKEKLLAALRGGITTALIPAENVKDLAEIPENVKSELEIIPVSTVDDVLKHALTRPVVPMEWPEVPQVAAQPPIDATIDGPVVKH